ncbi:hypothetical protein LTR27_005978 [Elasticomyces elasticus]|nr:hypothetical protein LTR27_005978 [Elasticomyces elasticus]
MWDYRRLLANTGVGEPDDMSDGCSMDQFAKRSYTKIQRGAPSLALQVYLAIAATVVCVLQIWILSRTSPVATGGVADLSSDTTTLKEFSKDHRYMSLDHKFDDLWFVGGNDTSILITEPQLGDGKIVPAFVSMYHQLHCLSSFRTTLQKAWEGEQIGFDYHDNHHWPHCFDYLRSTILCYGDATLELPRITDGIRTGPIDGATDLRRCRSIQSVREMVAASAAEASGKSG